MGRPPACDCRCGDVPDDPKKPHDGCHGEGDPPDFDAPFFSLVFADEAWHAYTDKAVGPGGLVVWPGDGQKLFCPDLKYLREKEQSIGRMNTAVIQPAHPPDHDLHGTFTSDALKPDSYNSDGPQGLPEEVVYYGQCVARFSDGGVPGTYPWIGDPYWWGKQRPWYLATSDAERQMMIHITNNLIRDKYQCIGVYICNVTATDTNSAPWEVTDEDHRHIYEHLLDEWYWNIGTSESSHAKYTRYIVDSNGDPWPLPSCTSGKLHLGDDNYASSAGGCVREISEDEWPVLICPEPYHPTKECQINRWVRNIAEGGVMMHEDPDGCASTSCCDSKSGWPEICAVTSDVTETPATVNFDISWILSGTGTTTHDTVTLEDQFGNVTNAEFKAEILEAFAVWKAALEHMCSWLTVTFTDLGDEIRFYNAALEPAQLFAGEWSSAQYNDTYDLPYIVTEPGEDPLDMNIGDIRIGMHRIDHPLENPEQNPAGVIAHAWPPRGNGKLGVRGNEGGDIHFDSIDAWRKDNESVAGARSVKWTAAHAIGTLLGLPYIYLPDTIMYTVNYSDKALGVFDVTFPDGVIGSTYDYAVLKQIYCIED